MHRSPASSTKASWSSTVKCNLRAWRCCATGSTPAPNSATTPSAMSTCTRSGWRRTRPTSCAANGSCGRCWPNVARRRAGSAIPICARAARRRTRPRWRRSCKRMATGSRRSPSTTASGCGRSRTRACSMAKCTCRHARTRWRACVAATCPTCSTRSTISSSNRSDCSAMHCRRSGCCMPMNSTPSLSPNWSQACVAVVTARSRWTRRWPIRLRARRRLQRPLRSQLAASLGDGGAATEGLLRRRAGRAAVGAGPGRRGIGIAAPSRHHPAGAASAPPRCSGSGRASPIGVKPSDTELRQWRSPVGGGPSGNTWPRWLPQRAHTISSRTMP